MSREVHFTPFHSNQSFIRKHLHKKSATGEGDAKADKNNAETG